MAHFAHSLFSEYNGSIGISICLMHCIQIQLNWLRICNLISFLPMNTIWHCKHINLSIMATPHHAIHYKQRASSYIHRFIVSQLWDLTIECNRYNICARVSWHTHTHVCEFLFVCLLALIKSQSLQFAHKSVGISLRLGSRRRKHFQNSEKRAKRN